MSRTIRRKNGYDYYDSCVKRPVFRDWRTGEFVTCDPWLKSWKYHGDSRWPRDGAHRWFKKRLSERRRAERRVIEHRYRVAISVDDVDHKNADRYLVNRWFWN